LCCAFGWPPFHSGIWLIIGHTIGQARSDGFNIPKSIDRAALAVVGRSAMPRPAKSFCSRLSEMALRIEPNGSLSVGTVPLEHARGARHEIPT